MPVACAGILVADLFANPIRRLPEPGELTTTSGLVMGTGGCAANTAIALRILGKDARVAGKVGMDMLGDFMISELPRHGIGIEHIRRTPNYPTSSTIVFNVEGEDRRYVHCIGANVDFTPDDIDPAFLDEADVLYLGGYLAMPSFTPERLSRIFRGAKQRGLITVLDVVMPAGVPFGIKHVARVLPYTDYFLPNQDEAGRLTGYGDPWRQAECLSRLNPRCAIVITRGPCGSVAVRGDRVIVTPPFRVETVDESGAGDAFAAGLITGLLEKWELDRALRFAAAVGASCTRALGCYSSVFSFDQAFHAVEEQFTAAAGRPA